MRAAAAGQSVAAAAADAAGGADIGAGQLRDDALDRSAGRELDDGEADEHDPEHGRDDQQQPLQQIGGHVGSVPSVAPRCDFEPRIFSWP